MATEHAESRDAPQIRQGSIYWLQNCPPLDDDNEKDRPVIVVDDPKTLKGGGPVIVIACSTKSRQSETDRIALPDKGAIPQTKSGLNRPTWAIPRWFFPVERARLNEYKGHLTGSLLKAVIRAYLNRVKS